MGDPLKDLLEALESRIAKLESTSHSHDTPVAAPSAPTPAEGESHAPPVTP
jgi:hypothetical protein